MNIFHRKKALTELLILFSNEKLSFENVVPLAQRCRAWSASSRLMQTLTRLRRYKKRKFFMRV